MLETKDSLLLILFFGTSSLILFFGGMLLFVFKYQRKVLLHQQELARKEEEKQKESVHPTRWQRILLARSPGRPGPCPKARGRDADADRRRPQPRPAPPGNRRQLSHGPSGSSLSADGQARVIATMVAALAGVALLVKVLPSFRQANFEWIAFWLPVHAALAFALARRRGAT